MFFGLPLRTTNETTDVVTSPSLGPLFQSGATRPASTSRVMSGSVENVTTSAFWPASTARDWSPEAPNEVLNSIPLPSGVLPNAGMISSYTTCGVEYATSDSEPFEPSPPDAAASPSLSSDAPPQPAATKAADASSAMIEVLVFTTSSKVGKPNRVGGEYNVLQRLDRVY